MTPPLASRLSAIKPSATIAIADRAAALRAQGVDVISFGVGEPDFPTPVHIRDAAKAAIDAGATRYTRVRGIAPLLAAIATDCEKRRGVRPAESEIVCSVGAKHSLFNLALALFEPGDEVLVPSPYWVSYPEQALIVGAVPKIIATTEEDGFLLRPEALEAAIGPKTKAIILCSPSNPTGAAYDEARLRAIAAVLAKHDIWVIVDEIYSQLVYEGFRQVSLLTIAPELRDRLVIVDGASKTYAMTGWRMGWIIAPPALCAATEMLQSQSTTNPTSFVQHATIAALEGPRAELDAMVGEFQARRDLMIAGLRSIDGIECRMPEGAFYAFPSVKGLIGRRAGDTVLADDMAVAAWMLEAAQSAVVPGAAFGAPGHVRLSYATSRELIAKGIDRIRTAVSTLR
ncbi:MAG: pyridoxal phosphate-dependent aminotransferase [Myxococcota bacterium]|nr:pyridoxal phosphate-dependent aminotransferase [Myxococcota bacterium]